MKNERYLPALILSSLTIMTAVFLFWELIEENFFANLDSSSLHFLYITRGVALGVILSAWSVWFILKYRRKYEQAQHGLQSQLFETEKLAALGELIGGVAHEVNNPVGIIISRLELMLSDAAEHNIPERFVRDLETLQKHASRIGTITQQLLSFSRKSGADYAPVDLNTVVSSTIPLIDHELKKKGIAIDFKLSPGLPKVKGNFNQLQQVLLNLLTNARDALAAGGQETTAQPVIQIGTWMTRAKDAVRLCVVDNGRGIAGEDRSRIFDPFYTTKKAGTGLGLSVSYGIVKEHGGTLTLGNDGQEGICGTCFTVALPAAGQGAYS